MTNNNGARDDATQTKGKNHLVLSAGGSRAILGGAGAVLAVDQALGPVTSRLRAGTMFDSIGGVSGGSMPAAFYAGGYSAADTVRTALDTHFPDLLTRHGSILQILFAYFMQGRFERTRPRHGVLSSEKLGDFIDEKLPQWPEKFWTMAVVGQDLVLFDVNGVRLISPDGKVKILSDKPAPLGLAIRATGAIPGIISAVPWKGRYLFDGALSPLGSCPVEIPLRFYNGTHPTTIACEVGDDEQQNKHALSLWKVLCGQNCIPQWETPDLNDTQGMVVVKPNMKHFKSLQFDLTRDQKWLAVMTAYVATFEAMKKANMVPAEKLASMEEICANWVDIEALGRESGDGLITLLVEDLLTRHGLL